MADPFNDVQQALLSVLAADSNLTVDTKVSQYAYGAPYPLPQWVDATKPVIAAEQAGAGLGSYKQFDDGADEMVIKMHVLIYVRDPDPTVAEKTAQDFAYKVRNALQANPTLEVGGVEKCHTIKLTGFKLDKLADDDNITFIFTWFIDIYQLVID